MKAHRESFIPNSTQIPNVFLDFIIPVLPSDGHVRVLLYLCRRTFGFGKKSDKIGLNQFVEGISNSETGERLDYGAGVSLITARRCLADLAEAGIIRKTSGGDGIPNRYSWSVDISIDQKKAERACCALAKRVGDAFSIRNLTRKAPRLQPSLFDEFNPDPLGNRVPESGSRWSAPLGSRDPAPLGSNTKESIKRKKKESIALRAPDPLKAAHKKFITFYHDTAKRVRGMPTLIIGGADGKNLKRVLALGIGEEVLEQLALYYLADPYFRHGNPTISSFLSAKVLNWLMNEMGNGEEFWRKLNGYVERHLRHEPGAILSPIRFEAAELRAIVARMTVEP